jgi:glycosyltransferase involved in cell wall biosynthesis
MKILHIIFSLNIGGSETMLIDIINEQSKTKKTELLIINDFANNELLECINNDIRIHFIKRKPGSKNPIPLLVFNYKVFKINPSVIHFHNHNGVKLLKYRPKALICLTVHSLNVPLINLSRYQKIFSISNIVQADILKRGGIKSFKIYNGIRFDKIKFSHSKELLTNFKIIQVSRLDHKIKGQDVLIQAISILVNKNIKNIQLDLIGDGNSRELLIKLTKELKIEDYVNFLGAKPRMYIYKELSNYQLLIQPSYIEGFGLTVVEGIAAKIPVLVSEIDGPMEIIVNGKYGFHFKTGDAYNLAEKIIEIIRDFQTEQFRNHLNIAHNYVKTNFNIQETAKKYIDNYE